MRATPFAQGAVVVVLAVLALLMTPAAPAATPCWKTVIGDWSQDGTINGRYPESCYRQAMQNAPTDLKVYSTIEQDLQSALRARTARRLTGTHVEVASLATAGGSSSLSMLVAVIGGIALVLAAGGTAVALVRRRGR